MGCCGGENQQGKSNGHEGHGNAQQSSLPSGSNLVTIVAVILVIAMAAWVLLK